MLYDVEQAAIKLNTTKQTVYVKLRQAEFKDKAIKEHGQTYLDETLIRLIKDSMKILKNVNNEEKCSNNVGLDETATGGETSRTNEDEINLNKNYSELLNVNKRLLKSNEELIEKLKDQLDKKDVQIATLHKLIENDQVLLKDKPEPKPEVLKIEEHVSTWNKILNWFK